MNALETLFTPLVRVINRQIRMTTPARELCRELQGKIVAVRIRNTGLSLNFRIDAEELSIKGGEYDDEPHAVITGSLLTLARLAGQSGESAVRDGSLDLDGDAEVARSFQRLLHYGRPDLEEELSGIFGDVAAHELGEFARHVRRWGLHAGSTLRQNLGEYLQEESRAVPTRYEVDRFRDRVETLRDDVARTDARLKRIESLAAADHSG